MLNNCLFKKNPKLILELLGWIGNIGFMIGVTQIAVQNISGFYWNFLGNFCYLLQAKKMNNWSLFLLSLYLMLINIYGIYHWLIS